MNAGRSLSTYGAVRSRPRWFVKWRGLTWLAMGCCPSCYSSPPQPDCPICGGDYKYGPTLSDVTRRHWRQQWLGRCADASRPLSCRIIGHKHEGWVDTGAIGSPLPFALCSRCGREL